MAGVVALRSLGWAFKSGDAKGTQTSDLNSAALAVGDASGCFLPSTYYATNYPSQKDPQKDLKPAHPHAVANNYARAKTTVWGLRPPRKQQQPALGTEAPLPILQLSR
jgi:hypothetical protein